VVWGLLVFAMTGVGGVLWMLDPTGKTPRLDGLALASLVTTDSAPNIEQVLSTRRSIERSRWKAIVIHHSATPSGTPETLAAKGGDSSFHFLIGNGNGMDDGNIYVDHRWLLQEGTRHVRGTDGPWYDQNAISICIVGDGERDEFSRMQMNRLVDLVHVLTRKLDIRPENVFLASDVSSERSPGRFFPGAELHERLAALGR
jgi:N-acetyl-anhydromuramyl-L-alanine amidase AmpD